MSIEIEIPINIPQAFLDSFIPKNIEFLVDEFEELIMQDAIAKNDDLKIKLNRDMTSKFNSWLDNKMKKKEKIVVNVKGAVRCNFENNLVLMSDMSLKKIKDCKVGEKVITLNENTNKLEIKKITEVYNNGKKDVYEIKLIGGRNIRCSKEHLFYMIKPTNEICGKYTKEGYMSRIRNFTIPTWTKLEELNNGDYIAVPRKLKIRDSRNFANNKIIYDLNSKDLELFGFYLSDGYIKKSDYDIVCFDLSKQDKIDYFYSLFQNNKKNYTFSRFEYKRKNTKYLKSNKFQFKKKNLTKKGKDFFTKLIFKYDLQDCLAKDKFIPNDFKNLGEKQIYALLSGLFNGDGSVDKNKGLLYITTSQTLFEDIKLLLLRLGIDWREFIRIPKNSNWSKTYILSIQNYYDINKIYKNCNLRDEHKTKLKSFIELINKKKLKNRDLNIVEDISFKKIVSITKLNQEQTYDFTIEDNHNCIINNIVAHNSGKSLTTLKIALRIDRFYQRIFDTDRIVCANQKEYRLKLKDVQFGECFQIDEKAFASAGLGANIEVQQLKDIENITAKKNIHTLYITPRTFLDTGAEIGLSYWGKDVNNWLSRFLLYSLKGSNPMLLGYVIFDVGAMFRDFGCFIYRSNGGCTNPNRLKANEISKEEIKYSYCIPNEFDEEQLADADKVCPFYEICKHPLNSYEHKKDKWIERELKGGLDERGRDRYETTIKLVEELGTFNGERILMKARNGKDLFVKIKMKVPMISNSKYSGEELKEIMTLIQSMSEIDTFKEICELVDINYMEVLEKITE